MDRKLIYTILGAGLILLILWFLGLCLQSEGSDTVKDLSGYMKVNPGESIQSQQIKQSYNLNQYLNQRDESNNSINSMHQRNLDVIDRTPTYKFTPIQHDYDNGDNYRQMQSLKNQMYAIEKAQSEIQMSIDVQNMSQMIRNAGPRPGDSKIKEMLDNYKEKPKVFCKRCKNEMLSYNLNFMCTTIDYFPGKANIKVNYDKEGRIQPCVPE